MPTAPPSTPMPTPAPTAVISGATPSEWLDFVSSIVSSLAWPVVLLIILTLFRGELVKLVAAVRDRIPSMTSMKLPGGVEAVWTAQAVEKLTREVDESLPVPPTSVPSSATQTPSSTPMEPGADKSIELAHIVPSAGVTHAFLSVERAIGDYLNRLQIPWKLSPLQELRRIPLPNEIRRAVDDLRRLRNAAAHGIGDISLESALDYIESARRVARAFDNGEYDRPMLG